MKLTEEEKKLKEQNEKLADKFIFDDQVREVAYLARLEMSDKETEKYQKELSGILKYVDQISKIDTKDVEPTAQVTGLSDVWRVDEKHPSELTRDEILSNAPDKKDGYIRVKPVLD